MQLNPFLLNKEGLNSNSLHTVGERAKKNQNKFVINTPTNLKESSNNSPNYAPIMDAEISSPSEIHYRFFKMDDAKNAFEQAKLVNPYYRNLSPEQEEKKFLI